ncbi:hypothetical protein [Bacillus gobiensis]
MIKTVPSRTAKLTVYDSKRSCPKRENPIKFNILEYEKGLPKVEKSTYWTAPFGEKQQRDLI